MRPCTPARSRAAWLLGQNPAVGGPNARFEREALEKLDWMVVQEIFQTETVDFWKAPGTNPAEIKTEVFVLPAADAMEKEGSIVTSGRLIQWRPKVAEAPGEALPDHDIQNLIGLKLKELYAAEPGPFADPITNSDLGLWRRAGPSRSSARWWISTRWPTRSMAMPWRTCWMTTATSSPRRAICSRPLAQLTADGKTACGNWLYVGYYYPMADGEGNTLPASKRRGQKDPGGLGIYPYWAYSWPVNRRIIYNRCSADSKGNPWPGGKDLIWWDAARASGPATTCPTLPATKGPDDPGFNDPFIMKTDGKGWLFGALNEGPFPTHYEPVESPTTNALYSSQQNNPAIKVWQTNEGQDIGDSYGRSPDKFPIVATTYRVVEHWQAGGMSRWLEWLAEAQPDMFVEMSEELAAGEGDQERRAGQGQVGTRRDRGGGHRHQALQDLPGEWQGRSTRWACPGTLAGAAAVSWRRWPRGQRPTMLTPHVGDANTTIPEYKAFLVNVEKA